MLQQLPGRDLVGADGKIGTVQDVYVDETDGSPTWVSVRTGLFGTRASLVPIAEATVAGDDVQVPYSKEKVKGAPNVDPDQHLSEAEEQELYSYYELGTVGWGQQQGTATATDAQGTVGRDVSGPTTDSAMTRSEEQLRVGTEQVETGRARLRKYVVTENVTTTVPVSREEVRIEREPITEANRGAALDGPELSEEEHEVVLTEERPVVQKEAVPVERVRLDTETVTEQREVSEQVRREEIDMEGGETPRRGQP